MLKIGIIGAGSISLEHLNAYAKNSDCKVVAIADLNTELAKKRAKEFGIEKVYTDYTDLLNDPEIEAVSVVTPTFTHKKIVTDSLLKGKDVLCEKPPALNAAEVEEMAEAAKKSGKLLMFALVCRFRSQTQFLKEFVDSGKMGKIINATSFRIRRCDSTGGWFINKSKSGGGPLIDTNIHEIDSLMYIMGYPKPKSILGFTSDAGKDLPSKIKGYNKGWVSADTNTYERDVENVANAFVTFENGACMHITTSSILHSVSDGTYIEICGEKAGAKLETLIGGLKLTMLDSAEGYFRESTPLIDSLDTYGEEINHFVDCVVNGKECICKLDEAVSLMKLIDGIYESARLGKSIEF